jgi:transcriptional regulator with XRE-family HTH domain
MKKSKSNSKQKNISEDQLKELLHIGYVIKELRFNYGMLTQKKLAQICGVHYNTIHAIEQGERSYNILSLMKIISYFGYDLSSFIKEFL